jgi:hypothetical protein
VKRRQGGRSAAWGTALVDKLIREGRLPADALTRKGPSTATTPHPAPEAPAPRPRMNKTETRMAQLLEARRLAGEISAWRFEPFSLKLAERTHYRPDFLVAHLGGRRPEIVEVKGGYIREDSWVKLKLAAVILGDFFDFTLAVYKGGNWTAAPVPR